jgi:lipoprotein-anchoring transpeptidase ErfK/SrfK
MGQGTDRDLYFLARGAASRGETDKSLAYMQRIYNEHPDSAYAHEAAAALAQKRLAEGNMWEARNLLSYAYDRSPDAETRKAYAAKMDEMNADLIYSPAGSRDATIYKVQPGDNLSSLAAKFNCPYRLIMKINGIKDARKLRAGQRLKIPSGPNGGPMEMSILVDKSDYRLTVYLNGYYLKEYHVGIGQYDFTPTGEFTVGERLEKPAWRGKPHGHPENILGDYWLTLDNKDFPGLGIHGTTEPETIGTKSSLGCIRMYNKDVGELYRMVPKGAKVTIRE